MVFSLLDSFKRGLFPFAIIYLYMVLLTYLGFSLTINLRVEEITVINNLCCIQERHWTSPGIAAALQAAINTPQSDRLKQALNMAPRVLDMYFAIALRDVNNCMLLPLLSSYLLDIKFHCIGSLHLQKAFIRCIISLLMWWQF